MRLYITEKPAQVKALKAALDKNGETNYDIQPLVGHIMEQANPTEYEGGLTKDWIGDYDSGKIPFVPTKWIKNVKRNTASVYKEAKVKIDKASEIVLASDPDNEGVVLVMEVLQKLGAVDKVIGMINMSKLDLTSLSREAKVMDKIPYKAMNEAGEARAKSDWLIGMNGTVAATVLLGNELGGVVHIGGVKLPIMRMVYDRDCEFENFKKIPFYTIKGQLKKGDKSIEVSFKMNGETKFSSEEEAKKVLASITEGIVEEVEVSDKKTAPGKPYSLTDLQANSSKKLNLNAAKTLEIAQKLYDGQYQSYPRTDSNYYAEGEYEAVESVISNLANSGFKEVTDLIQKPFKKRDIFNDSKIDAHTALAPTDNKASFGSKDEEEIYKMVAERYLIQFLEDYEYISRKVSGSTNVEGLKFECSNNQTKDLGFKIVDKILYKKEDENEENKMPDVEKGEEIKFEKLELVKGESKPRPRFSEAALLLGMEKIANLYDDPKIKENLKEGGIGTPATRGAILKELFEKGYLEYENKSVKSTKKTRDLMKILPDFLTSPVLRAELENGLKSILKSEKTQEDIVDSAKETVIKAISEMEDYVEKNGIKRKSKVSLKEIELKCPKCGGKMFEAEKYFKCENTGKYDSKNKKWDGECNFVFIKGNKLIDKIFTEEMLKDFIEGKEIKFDKGVMKFDKEADFFSKVEWENKENYDMHKFSFSSKGKKYQGWKDKCSEGEERTRKTIFEPFLGVSFTETEARDLFEGKTVEKNGLTGKNGKFKAKLKLVKKGNSWNIDMSF